VDGVDVDERRVEFDVVALASQVRSCAIVEQAVRLARWVGDDRRPVTAGKVLRPLDIAAAGAAIGVEVPKKARSAALVPALHRPWCVAVAAGLLVIGKGAVTAGPGLVGWASVDESDVMAGWLAGLRAVCRAESDRRHPHSVAILALLLLEVLSADEPVRDLQRAVHKRITGDDVFNDGCDDRTFRQYLTSGADERFGGLLALLRLFGAVTAGSGEARSTPLGRWAVSRLRAGMPHSAGPELSAAEVIDLIVVYGGGTAELEWKLARPWLAARGPEVAARELLGVAAGSPASLRVAAIEVVDMLDEPALPVWRDLAGDATIGPHARAVLASWDEQDPALAVRPEDGAWLAVEAAAAALAGPGPDEALTLVYEGIPGSDVDSRIAAVGASGHPEAETLAQALTRFVGSGRPRTVGRVHCLKVTLLGSAPPIWRRVRVPSIASLGALHSVVQVLFGWEGDHLHVFDANGEYYSDPFMNLEQTRDEFDTRVASVLSAPKQTIVYRYDLGADWRHEIVLEEVVDREGGRDVSVCVGFGGDSPVEYEYEDEPEEPAPFDLDAVNRQLAGLEGDE
jgi:hypothetical protein